MFINSVPLILYFLLKNLFLLFYKEDKSFIFLFLMFFLKNFMTEKFRFLQKFHANQMKSVSKQDEREVWDSSETENLSIHRVSCEMFKLSIASTPPLKFALEVRKDRGLISFLYTRLIASKLFQGMIQRPRSFSAPQATLAFHGESDNENDNTVKSCA